MSWTVKQLIEELKTFDPNLEVYLTSNYGDHANTEQALELEEVVVAELEESGYSESGLAVKREEEDFEPDIEDEEEEPEEPFLVLALRTVVS